MEKESLSIKSRDTEEKIDVYFNRPIGYLWALFFKRLGVHPNTVTIMSMVLGVAAGVCFYFSPKTTPYWFFINLVGVLLLMWANFYDSADGQLARMTNQKTHLGRILDGTAGDVWFFVIYHALAFRMWNDNIPFTSVHWGWWGFLLLAFDGYICHVSQARLSDYYRNIHLFFVKGEAGSELDNSDRQKAIYDQMPWKGNHFVKGFQWIYINYTRAQEKATPQFQRLRAALKAKYGDNIPAEFCERFRQRSFRILWCTNALVFNQRAITLYIAVLADIPWLMPLVEIVYLGSVYFYMKRYHENMCREFADEL